MSAPLLVQLQQEVAAITAAASKAGTLAYPRPEVAFVNQSTVMTDATCRAIMTALQVQVDRDFALHWFRGAHLVFYPKLQTPPASAWQIVILDNTDQAGALGYHDLTQSGLPIGKVFAKTDAQFNLQPSVTTSHELLEMLADPKIDELRGIYVYQGVPAVLACEVGDPVEADRFGYIIDGVLVSDFVTPNYFHPGLLGPYSFRGTVTSPLALSPGGYQSYFPVGSGGTWKQMTAASDPNTLPAQHMPGNPRTTALHGSRRERRHRGHEHWQYSTHA